MTQWHELSDEEKQAAVAFQKHWNINSRAPTYPPTIDGVQRYVTDHGAQLIASAVVARYGARVLRYLERWVRGL